MNKRKKKKQKTLYHNLSLTFAVTNGKWTCKRMHKWAQLRGKKKWEISLTLQFLVNQAHPEREYSMSAEYLLKFLLRKMKGNSVKWKQIWMIATCLLSWLNSSSNCGKTAGSRHALQGHQSMSSMTQQPSKWHNLRVLGTWLLLQQHGVLAIKTFPQV